MRHCFGETVTVFEAVGKDLPALLVDAANTITENGHPFSNVHTTMNEDCEYTVTVYLH
jgi:hypothetical protein